MGTKILSAEGIEVIAVSNGDAAVKKLQGLDFDLVLADVYMPGLDGYEVCQWVKNSADHPGLPVVLVVGALEPLVPDRISQAGADGLLKKPFEASAMMAMLRPLIDASIVARPSRKKNEIDPEKTIPIHDRTVEIPPPVAPAAETDRQEDTVKIDPAPSADFFESTVRIPAPKGSKDVRAQDSGTLAGATAAGTAAAAEPPAPEPIPEPSASPPLAEMADPETGHQPKPTTDEMTIPDMAMAAAPEDSMAEFEIPDMSSHGEAATDQYDPTPEPPAPKAPVAELVPPVAAAAAPRWVAEPTEVTPSDEVKFPPPDPSRTAGTGNAPPDWGELLKSVEDGPSAIRAATPAPALAVTARVPEEIAAPSAGALELEMPVEPEPPPPAPVAAEPTAPAVDEDELRMTIQLCLENALPSLVDEVTSAVLRRLGRS